ncbi:uncharacterized protein MELLADRAFT_85525 [Melampsora larici-populina 98AG31]|uniref:Secreted protein n=1 Tax=Melampsora larici-populina (strain 98AG31 / pathotype 3-4-7) TaxID=747676 RepID=F4RJ17_MELLP|nr:uncharacterized protein MELLADRAFT_85525 [Melampsora larici-populina 98AG31]EGG07656.1 hypothetical protein MELLADRAFT_85525 [Melampsora larici-populina 98AG31]
MSPASIFITIGVAFCHLLVATASPEQQSSQLARRSSSDPDPALRASFITPKNIIFEDGGIRVFNLNSQEAYKVTHHIDNARQGYSEYVTTDVAGNVLLRMNAYDDFCFGKTHYVDQHDLLRVKIDPRGMYPDEWTFTSRFLPGFKYEFDRNAMSADGKIFEADNKKLVATLHTEKRHEPWLLSRFHADDAYVLRSDGTVPDYYLVTLMALVQMRVNTCGI